MTPEKAAIIRADFRARIKAAGYAPSDVYLDNGKLDVSTTAEILGSSRRYAQEWGVPASAMSELLRGRTFTGNRRKYTRRQNGWHEAVYQRWVELGGLEWKKLVRPSIAGRVAQEMDTTRNTVNTIVRKHEV